MMPSPCLIFSDLDGTLLNHHDYQMDAALPLLHSLKQQNIPVIFNTSKTFAEMQALHQKLQWRAPFIVENGSCIYLPADYFSPEVIDQLDYTLIDKGDYLAMVLGESIDVIHQVLSSLTFKAVDFTRCSVDQAVALTGLDRADAIMALQREFSVPMIFECNDEQSVFIKQVQAAGLSILKGGRFVHVLGQCNKGMAMTVLTELYQQQYGQVFSSVALGDSDNDIAMLEASDIAIIVQSPSSHRVTLTRSDAFLTKQPAPQGWVEGVEYALASLFNTITTGVSHGR